MLPPAPAPILLTPPAPTRPLPAAALLALSSAVALATVFGGCATAGPGPAEEPAPTEEPAAVDEPAPDARPAPQPAPWSAPPLRPTGVPEVLLQQWARAENRRECAPLAPAGAHGPRDGAAGTPSEGGTVVVPPEAEPRAARFAGGWGVAWDLPDLRSAFGVAGTGVEPDPATYDEWPHRMEWADGSAAGYGPEGGTGPNQLAYLTIPGQTCLYNVWSRLGVEHLERLLGSLRRVRTP